MRLFVTGGEGQVARSLREVATLTPGLTVRFAARPEFDLLRPSSIKAAIDDFRPDIVVNPAAYTAVDTAESDSQNAFAINRDGALAVAMAAAEHDVPVIHLSTDYVFDGKKNSPYGEDDEPAPQGVYGASKLAGERAVAEANAKHIILRTSWVYAPFGKNFVGTVLRLARDQGRLRIVDDQLGCPTYAPDIASAIIHIACRVHTGFDPRFRGVIHLAGPDERTWFAFAREIIQEAEKRGGPSATVDPISTADYPTPAPRPANSRLSSAKLESVFALRLPALELSLSDCLNRLLPGQIRVLP